MPPFTRLAGSSHSTVNGRTGGSVPASDGMELAKNERILTAHRFPDCMYRLGLATPYKNRDSTSWTGALMGIDSENLARLLVREHEKLAAYTWQIVREYHLLSEVLQEMAVVAMRKADRIADERHFPAWARCTCRNLALDLLRQQRRRPILLGNSVLDSFEAQWSRWDAEDSSSLTVALRDCLRGLSRHARQIVELRYGRGRDEAATLRRLLPAKPSVVRLSGQRSRRRGDSCLATPIGAPRSPAGMDVGGGCGESPGGDHLADAAPVYDHRTAPPRVLGHVDRQLGAELGKPHREPSHRPSPAPRAIPPSTGDVEITFRRRAGGGQRTGSPRGRSRHSRQNL